jgi:hypothetical protein
VLNKGELEGYVKKGIAPRKRGYVLIFVKKGYDDVLHRGRGGMC